MSLPLDRLRGALADRYRIERELGAGGMATVYLAADLKHDRKVAIKVLKPELAAVLGADRFVVEIKTTAAMSHPHILPLFDSGTADGFLFYVMPFIEGETIREKLNRETQFGVDEAVRIAREVADALDYAHRHGVIHRDIKPENILLHDGRPMVMDFGIALAVSAAAGGRMTETGLSLGTPHYMSPEQATADKDLSARSDIYSLASVLYEMLAGSPPHVGSTAQQVIMKIITDVARPVHELRRNVPANVDAALQKALEKLPPDRFSSAKEFADALMNPAYAGTIARAAASDHATGAGVPRGLFAVTAGTALVAIAIAGWLLASRPRAIDQPVMRVSMDLPDSLEFAGRGAGSRIALSPDGSMMVFVGRVSTGSNPSTSEIDRRVYLRRRDQLTATPIPGTEGGTAPFFAPDGKRLGFITRGSATIKVVEFDGAPPVTIADSGLGGGTIAAFGPDGSIYASGTIDALVRFPASGGRARTRVSTLDTASQEVGHVGAAPLPNGKGVIFTVVHRPSQVNTIRDVAVLDLATGKHKVLVRGVLGRYALPGYLVFVRADGVLSAAPFDQDQMVLTGDPVPLANGIGVGGFGGVDFALSAEGTLAYLSGGTGDASEVVWAARDGKMTVVQPGWHGDFTTVSLSPEGTRLAVAIAQPSGEEDIWIMQLNGGQLSRLTFGGPRSRVPTWTPDGRRVLYVSDAKVPYALVTRRADGNGPSETVAQEARSMAEGVISNDGKWLLYRTSSADSGSGDIMARRFGDSVSVPLVTTRSDERHPTLSPDGRWLAYRSAESGTPQIYVRPFPNVNEGKWQVSTTGGSDPVWSHTGKELFYLNGANELVSAMIPTPPAFAALTQRVLFALPADIRFNASRPLFDVSPDDRRFLMTRAVGSDASGPIGQARRQHLVVVSNFFSELKTRVSPK